MQQQKTHRKNSHTQLLLSSQPWFSNSTDRDWNCLQVTITLPRLPATKLDFFGGVMRWWELKEWGTAGVRECIFGEPRLKGMVGDAPTLVCAMTSISMQLERILMHLQAEHWLSSIKASLAPLAIELRPCCCR